MTTKTRLARLAAVALAFFALPALAQECPKFMMIQDVGCWASDVALSEGYAFVACSEGGLVVVDVSRSWMPQVVASDMWSQGTASNVALQGDFAYLSFHSDSAESSGVIVYDISQPSFPESLGEVIWQNSSPATHPAGRLVAAEEVVYFVRNSDVLIIDVSNPLDPIIITSVATPIYSPYRVSDTAVSEDRLYVLDGIAIHIYDVTSPSQPVQLGIDPDSGCSLNTMGRMVVRGKTAFVTCKYWISGAITPSGSLNIVSLEDPVHPFVFWSSGQQAPMTGIALSEGYVYAPGYVYPSLEIGRELRAFDCRNPFESSFMGFTETFTAAEEVAAGGGFVYIADNEAGLSIYGECGTFFDGFESGDTTVWSAAVP